MKSYEIHNLTTGELLVDNLAFDDMPELYGAYLEFYPYDDIIVCCREIRLSVTCARIIHHNDNEVRRQKFYAEWLTLMDELSISGNISYGGA